MEPKLLTRAEYQLISKIAARAVGLLAQLTIVLPVKDYQFSDIKMDIEELHTNTNPMRLLDWFESPDGEFMHDIIGIYDKIDRNACNLKDGFVPRYSDGDEYRRRNSEAEVEEILEYDQDEIGKPDPTDLPTTGLTEKERTTSCSTGKLITEGIDELEAQQQAAFDKTNAVKIHYIETGDMLTQKQLDAFNAQPTKTKRVLQEIADYQGIIYTELDGMERYDYRFWGPAEFLEELTGTATYQEFKDQSIDFIITYDSTGYWMRRKLEQFEHMLIDPSKYNKKEKLS